LPNEVREFGGGLEGDFVPAVEDLQSGAGEGRDNAVS
jgi:hypothetical protein